VFLPFVRYVSKQEGWNMFSRRIISVVATVLAAGALAGVTGCDWLKGSDPGLRQSPVISSLSISRSSVLCNTEFTVSFHYEDRQGDIANAKVTFQRSGEAVSREETPTWPDTISRSSGTATFTFSFTSCDGKGGVWTIAVEAQDDQGNSSNTLSGQITLTSAG
jgi:hypothetical protein